MLYDCGIHTHKYVTPLVEFDSVSIIDAHRCIFRELHRF